MFTLTPPTDLAPQVAGLGAPTRELLKRTWASKGQTPTEAQHREGQMGSCSPQLDTQCWGADYMAGKVGCPPFFRLFPSHTENRCVSQSSPVYTNYSACLWVPCFLFPTPLKYSGIWRRQPCPTQRCQKWGLLDRGPGPTPPRAPPPSAPPDGFITSFAAHLKPIDSLGGQECLTRLSTSEGASATLENRWLGFGVGFVF